MMQTKKCQTSEGAKERVVRIRQNFRDRGAVCLNEAGTRMGCQPEYRSMGLGDRHLRKT